MSFVANAFYRFRHSLSGIGLALGTLLFAAALTPSLVPRTYVMQGILCGVAFGSGYGRAYFGVGSGTIWSCPSRGMVAQPC
ncbi:hypothetical protein HGG75_18650 [Ochrobactrum pseudogrignonense]|nr:hypothetical protein [Brucella pseudogrignonensis]